MKDSIVGSVIKKFEKRSKIGIEKYGVTLDRTDLNFQDWVNHAQEEAMDFILYLEKMKQEHKPQKNMTITELTQKAYNTAKDKGFHETPMNIPEKLMLIVSELGEAMEADRTGAHFEGKKGYINNATLLYLHTLENDKFPQAFKDLQKDTFEDEIADVFIRLFDLCGALDIDIEKHIQLKMRYNETRQRKHGKNY